MSGVLDELVEEISQIRSASELAAWKQHRDEITPELIGRMMARVRQLLESAEFEAAGRLSEWCIVLADELADPVLKAAAAVTKGIALGRVNEDANALHYFDKAFHLYQDAGQEVLAAKVRMNRVMCYCHLSRYEDALREGELAGEVFTRLGEKSLLARNLNNVGEVLFRLDRFQEWLAALDRAVDLLHEIGDEKSLAMVYMNRAVAYTSLNRPAEAVHYYTLSKELCDQTGQTWLAACCNYNLGYLHYVQGEYTKALDILTETREVFSGEQWYVPLCDLTQSEILLEMNMHRDADRLAERAYQTFELTGKSFEMAKAVGVRAIAKSQIGEFREAATLFEQARTMFEAQGNAVRAAAADLYRGMMWLGLGRYDEARVVAERAFEAFSKENVKPKAALACLVRARANLKLGQPDNAAADARTAAALHGESPAPWVAPQLHAVQGEIYLAQNETGQARTQLQKAIEELERVRANIAPDELRLNYLRDKVPVYEMLLDVSLSAGDPASLREAFRTTERSRSRTLVDLLAGSIDSLRHVASSSVEDVQEALAQDTALIEYCMIGDKVMAFCVSKSKFEVATEICSRADVKKRFDLLQFHLSRLAGNPQAAARRANTALLNVQDHLQKLHEMLIAPIESFLAGMQSVVFVPFDFLHYLPYHALFDGSSYLTDCFTISYASTATIFRLFAAKEARATGPALLVGVPDERAPFIAGEIEGIRSVLPNARYFVGTEATRERLAGEMNGAGLIHIASHASFRPDNPMFSSIQLHDGTLNFFDIYGLRTTANLITLSGCGTGLSSVVAGEELLGLVRGFLYAGATSVVISLWDVHDRTTSDLMTSFYRHLSAGHSKGESLRLAMADLRQKHPHPYYWAPFLLMGNPT